MSKKNNIKRIALLLIGLIVVMVVLKIKEGKEGDRSFKSEVVAVDTAKIESITIVAKANKRKTVIYRKSNNWLINLSEKEVQADITTTNEILTRLKSLKPLRVVATNKSNWGKYDLTDSMATHVIINEGKKPLADLYVGKFDYDPQTRAMTTYVRNNKEDEVYAVDGFLNILFNGGSSGFRDNTLLVGDPENWKKLVFTYPADSSFTLIKQNNTWMVDGIMADSIKVQDYFSKIRMLTDNNFADDVIINDSDQPDYTLRIESDSTQAIEVKGFLKGNTCIAVSSKNYGNIFNSTKILPVLFASKAKFQQQE